MVDSVKVMSTVLKMDSGMVIMASEVTVLQQISAMLRIINIWFSVQLSVGASHVTGITQMWKGTKLYSMLPKL